MAADLMTKCEAKRPFIIDEKKVFKWVEVDVSQLSSGSQHGIRCAHCHGDVRVHKQQVKHGPADHVEHMSRQDSERCRGGHHFKGIHQLSQHPVE